MSSLAQETNGQTPILIEYTAAVEQQKALDAALARLQALDATLAREYRPELVPAS